jgi:hypothetical protein
MGLDRREEGGEVFPSATIIWDFLVVMGDHGNKRLLSTLGQT